MMRSRYPSRLLPLCFLGILPLVAAPALEAQAGSGEGMAFPRQALEWYLAGEGALVWEHAGTMMRELSESPAMMSEAARDITEAMGPITGVLGEQMFTHPEDADWRVYVRTVRHAEAPEIYWIVIFRPRDSEIGIIAAQPRQTMQVLFPDVRLH